MSSQNNETATKDAAGNVRSTGVYLRQTPPALAPTVAAAD